MMNKRSSARFHEEERWAISHAMGMLTKTQRAVVRPDSQKVFHASRCTSGFSQHAQFRNVHPSPIPPDESGERNDRTTIKTVGTMTNNDSQAREGTVTANSLRYFFQSDEDEVPTVGLEFFTGESLILSRVEGRLDVKSPMLCCRVSVWRDRAACRATPATLKGSHQPVVDSGSWSPRM